MKAKKKTAKKAPSKKAAAPHWVITRDRFFYVKGVLATYFDLPDGAFYAILEEHGIDLEEYQDFLFAETDMSLIKEYSGIVKPGMLVLAHAFSDYMSDYFDDETE